MAPFAKRECGPHWFKRAFPATKLDDVEETNHIWYAYLTSQYLSTWISTHKASLQFGVQPSYPSIAARQFGLCQLRPGAFYRTKQELLHSPNTEGEWKAYLSTFAAYPFHLAPIAFEPCFSCTAEFTKWWNAYSREKLSAKMEEALLPSLISTFPSQQHKTKSKGTHAKGIKTFQTYFETTYDPSNIS